jgi:ATP phosphoribosyltransferase
VITLALSKGRILDESLPLLAAAGIALAEDPEASRKLIVATSRPDLRIVLVRASDVPTYVQHGGADLGVVGLDTLSTAARASTGRSTSASPAAA